ncbi:D-methionine transport system substrate-binding protein [Hydrogenoanaerobacterium saccharovorans]|uniref:Lipoprotein n=1 Tax=Hydrogenoanaerobacterium saccharovorans TaxID=474960 RepID=A0A1H8A0W6_9FIRM|nr:MetQ/NlpA family ABC transporter substrate-binding protein [Hydrogenoanaerobacterium saccharovorans]RPF48287.1 D-methionine transport system substrate-binding protein [Hydrogenoanaerobacterium saccharovorans]SEM63488.1 D-methionine transport system substrate-binding protein [Hydrogenoanaerobacterium saccharovorans]
MKKIIALTLTAALILTLFAGCAAKQSSSSSAVTSSEAASGTESTQSKGKIVIGASPTPHGEILKVAKEVLAKQGYELEVTEFTDYIQPNLALQSSDLDANYFQHKPYLDDFNVKNKTDLVSIAAIHYEPFGIYAGKTKTIADLKDGAQIAVPNDTTNEARALLLLEKQGLIKLKPDAGLEATVKDITENTKKLKIVEIEAAQLARSLPDVDLAVINGNYAIQAGFNVSTDALTSEDKDSLAATNFANIIAIRAGDENREDLKALVAALKSDEVKNFINNTYKGAVVPMF